MTKQDITIGGIYYARISGDLTTVRIEGVSVHGGWHATNTKTQHPVRIRTAGKLRGQHVPGAFFLRATAKHEAGTIATLNGAQVFIVAVVHVSETRSPIYTYAVRMESK